MAALELINSTLFNDPNLISYWRFEGNSNDAKDSNNGTDTGIVYSSGNGMFGQGMGGNGTTSRIALGTNVANLKFTSAYTYFGWWKTTAVGPLGAFQTRSNVISNGGYVFQMQAHVVRFAIGDGAGANKTFNGAVTVDDGNWHMITCTWDGTTMAIYVDGNLDQSTNVGTFNPGYETSTYSLIGAVTNDNAVFDQWWDGSMDDVAVFNRALSAGEILSHFNGTDPIAVPLNVDTTGSFIQGVKIVG